MEMIKVDTTDAANFQDKPDVTSRTIPSCLRNGNNLAANPVGKNRVSFPEDERDLVTGYVEPPSPWDNVPVSPEDLVAVYEESCRKHDTPVLSQVVDQLQACWQPSPCLELSGPFDLAALEALEPVLRRVRFQTFRLQIPELDDDAAVALFDMLEYYESTAVFSISCDAGLGLRAWQACSRMIKKAHCLEELDARGTALNEQVMPVLCRSLKVGSRLTALRLGRCGLSGRCLVVLAAALRLNNTLEELTIADNELVSSDAVQLGLMLRVNNTLKFLDISNNDIQDAGCSHICEGLCEQKGEGIEALVLWNTNLTQECAPHIASVFASSCPLETLNIGQNRIGSDGLLRMKQEMSENRTLKQLGVQAAHITCEGAIVLAEILSDNTQLRRIDARSNHIGEAGLTAIQRVLHTGASVHRLDLDDSYGVCQDLIEEIREMCRTNEAKAVVEEEIESKQTPNLSRKISLTCETLFMKNNFETNNNLLMEPRRCGRLRSPEPSPIPSPSSSPVPSPSRNRFRVSRVSESSSECSNSPTSPISSRFRVTLVEPSTVVASGAVNQVGFHCSPQSSENDSGIADTSSSSLDINKKVETEVSPDQTKLDAEQERKRKVSGSPAPKPQSSLERLLGLFQNPGSFFSAVSLSSDKKDKNSENIETDKVQKEEARDENWEWDWSSIKNQSNSNNVSHFRDITDTEESQTKNNNLT